MKKLISASLLTALAATSAMTHASDKVVYDYWQFGYIHSAGERTSDKVGYNIDISGSWTESVYLHGTYNDQSADVWAITGEKGDVSAKEYSLAIGWHTPMSRTSDFFAELGYMRHDGEGIIPQSPYGNDEDGFFTKLGIRGRFSANWEYSVFAGYKDFDFSPYVDALSHEDDNDTIFGLEGRYYFSPSWSLGVTVSEETTGLTSNLNIRFNL
ncbi:MAG: hypothetical protein HWD86_09915 [Kangiellaceae bacterium]|nr:hypothetical protein [Kangiellaceae bacterium]